MEDFETTTPMEDMTEFLSQFLPLFDVDPDMMLGDSAELGGVRIAENWDEDDRLAMLQEIAMVYLLQLEVKELPIVPWSAVFFLTLSVVIEMSIRSFFMGYMPEPRTDEAKALTREALEHWSNESVETLLAWMEGNDTDG